jgi:hypothetical protein
MEPQSTRILDKLKWTTVRGFGAVKYFNISYGVLFLVPVLAELYEHAVPAMKWFGAPGPFPTTLKWLYSASVFFAIGIALYQYFCPKEIKRFGNADEYLKANYEIFLRANPAHRLEILIANLDPNIDQDLYRRIDDLSVTAQGAGEGGTAARGQLEKLVEEHHGNSIQRFLLNTFDRENVSRRVARWGSFLCYAFGATIVIILLVLRSWHVLTA